MAKEARYEYASSARAPASARCDLDAFLHEEASEEVIERAILLVDELVTNAVVHAGGTLEVRARLDGSGLRVEVMDSSPALPQLRQPDIGGRGLRIVSSIARAWGVNVVEGHGKAVWFEL